MPRSASRDLADRFLGNRRYFTHWNRLERMKLAFSGVALLGVLLWGAYTLLGAGRGGSADYQASHGPLASVHGAWDTQCDACHQPKSGDGLLDAHGRWNTFTCTKCHGAGEHVANMKPDFKVLNDNCAGCHKDHNGRDFKLTKLPDSNCVECHRNISAFSSRNLKNDPNITGFAGDHPPFAKLMPANQKRSLKFSHSIHLTPGMVLAQEAGNALRYNAEFRMRKGAGRYSRSEDIANFVIQLDCKSCHEPDGAGNYKSVRFEDHCGTCHPTTAANVVAADRSVLPSFEVPHGVVGHHLQEELLAKLSLLLLKDHPKVAETPGNLAKSYDPAVKAFTEDLKAASTSALTRILADNCSKCHIPAEIVDSMKKSPRWFGSARFNHVQHQSADCASCHPGAASKLGTPEHEREINPYDIPNIDNCRQCHAPKTDKGGGIKHGCTDCHTYHHADKPDLRLRELQSPGKPTLTVEDFLRGGGRK